MTGLPDPETLIGGWLKTVLPGTKVWWDPAPPSTAWATAAWAWIQRGQGGEVLARTLDDVLLDVDVFAAAADPARLLAGSIWAAMTGSLPRTTLPDGTFVTGVWCVTRPVWVPADRGVHRSATYRIVLHQAV